MVLVETEAPQPIIFTGPWEFTWIHPMVFMLQIPKTIAFSIFRQAALPPVGCMANRVVLLAEFGITEGLAAAWAFPQVI